MASNTPQQNPGNSQETLSDPSMPATDNVKKIQEMLPDEMDDGIIATFTVPVVGVGLDEDSYQLLDHEPLCCSCQLQGEPYVLINITNGERMSEDQRVRPEVRNLVAKIVNGAKKREPTVIWILCEEV